MTKYIRNDGRGNSCVLEITGEECEVSILTAQEAENMSDQEWYATVHEAINATYSNPQRVMRCLSVIM